MRVDGPLADDERGGNLAIGVTASYQRRHLPLTLSEIVRCGWLESLRPRWARFTRPPGQHGPHGVGHRRLTTSLQGVIERNFTERRSSGIDCSAECGVLGRRD